MTLKTLAAAALGWLLTAPPLGAANSDTAPAADVAPAPTPSAKPGKSPKLKPVPVPRKEYPAFGQIERLDPALDDLIPPDAVLEKLAGGFEWAEGPVWNRKTQTLLFSDVPRNVVFEWKEDHGTRDYLFPSGYTGTLRRGGEPGSNGLILDAHNRLVLCQHGDRRVARWDPDTRQFVTLAQYYLHRRFNSPNDLVYNSKGDLYFTDPPYGLLQGNQDPLKELVFNGVYLLRRNGEVVLLSTELPYPNGIALSPDEKTLYVAVSDRSRPSIAAFDVKADGTVENGRIFFDAIPLLPGRKGLPDGLKVDYYGNLFATGPGGVLVLTPEGKHLGTIDTGEATANCAWGDDGSTLYITADMYLCRVKTTTKGLGFGRPKKKR
ncbi:MAG: SMP-30/gluconolactonase/LRE family protein [Verrucomicrobia bacterium]|nr:SMP-30/gluconolactonase/LRE family protein [Verrucomicrobiota bacterium]